MGVCTEIWAEPEKPVKKSELRVRFLILALLSVGLFGSYYVYDIPAATEAQMAQTWSTNATSTQFNTNFNLLYSVYSWPNVILPFFGGYFADLLGVRLMGVVFTGLIALGQLITAVGSSIEDLNTAWYVMWIGRTIFGFGGESLSVVQSAFIAQYFQGKELAFALGLTLAFARVGSVVNNIASYTIAGSYSLYAAYFVGFLVTFISLIFMIVAFYVDLRSENRIRASKGYAKLENQGLLYLLFVSWWSKKKEKVSQIASGNEEDVETPLNVENGESDLVFEPPPEKIELSAVIHFPLIFWILTMSCVTIYIDVLVYNNNSSNFILQRLSNVPIWQLTTDQQNSMLLQANSIMSITYLIAGFLTPVIGAGIDVFGYRAVLNLFAATLITGVHLTFSLTSIYPVYPLVVLGICYSIYASALWPSIALVVEEKYCATAYGVVTAVQNLGLAVGPLIVASLLPATDCPTVQACLDGWNRTEMFFVGMGVAGVFFGIALNVVDYFSKSRVLNLSTKAVKERLAVLENKSLE
jgi:MFS family permease